MGSSAISTRGSQLTAMAITARWRMPPDSSWGNERYTRAGSGMPTWPSSSRARALAAARLGTALCWRSTSVIWAPMRRSGSSAADGSWGMRAISGPRTLSISLGPAASRSPRPSSFTVPAKVALAP